MDFLVNLPSSMLNNQKFNSFFVVGDTFSKMCHLIPTTTNVNAEGVVKLLDEILDKTGPFPEVDAEWRRVRAAMQAALEVKP